MKRFERTRMQEFLVHKAVATCSVALLLVLLSLVGPALSTTARSLQQSAPEPYYQNPVIDQDFPDPSILKDGDTYYAYATNSGTTNIQEARSTDLVHWQSGADALPRLPSWAIQRFGFVWSPDVSKTSAGYVMYFVARFKSTLGEKQCIGTATSETPTGPFQPQDSKPLICQADLGGSIDPASFVDTDGARYVVWKNDGNSVSMDTWLFVQRVSGDGLTLLGQPIKLIKEDQFWEGRLVEAPDLIKHNGRYYLFYSANSYADGRYAVGYAVADALQGPYTKPAKPLLTTNLKSHIIGPGGENVVTDGAANTWIVFHSWDKSVKYRSMNIAPLMWQNNVPIVALNPTSYPAPELGGMRQPF